MRLNIHYKITLLIISLIAVILAGIYFYLNTHLAQYSQQQIETQLKRDVQLAKAYFESQYRFNLSAAEVDKIVDTIAAELEAHVTVTNREGSILGDSQLSVDEIRALPKLTYRFDARKMLTAHEQHVPSLIETKRDSMSVMTMIGKEGALGIIRLAVSLESVKSFSEQLRHVLFMALIAAFIFSIVFSFLASSFISNPIKEISQVAQAIASSDFSRKLMIYSNDEIETLARSLNHMSEQIKMRMSEVMAGKSRLEAVFLSMIEGVVVVDIEGTIILMNQSLRDLLHVENNPVGKKPLEMIRNIEVQEVVDHVLHQKTRTLSREITLLVPEEKIILIHAAPVIHESKVDGAVLIFHDITGLRQLEKVRQDFVANVSHELRTPVSTIKGYAETLLNGALDDKENALDFIKIIYTDSDRLAKLVNDLLDLSRIESGKLNIHPKPVVISTVIERIRATLLPQLTEKRIILKNEISSKDVRIIVDEHSAIQIMFNLIENAIKYNKIGGQILITAQEADGDIAINIQDTGLGISEKDLPRIFERFYRADKAHSRDVGGTGLGLSIVKHLVQINNGTIRVESILTVGSTFTVSFPRA